MPDFAAPLQRLIDEFRRLPGIGQKSAQRLAFHVLRTAARRRRASGRRAARRQRQPGHLRRVQQHQRRRAVPLLPRPPSRPHQICVVEEPHNILPIETTRTFEGLYHVLNGAISPLRGIGPEQLKIKGLLDRIVARRASRKSSWRPIPTVEGEATAVYLSRLLKPLGMKVTRIAMGIPVGSDLEFSDEVTISKSLENRREM